MSIRRYWLEEARSLSIKPKLEACATRRVFPSPQSIDGKVLADMLCGDHVSMEAMWRRYDEILGSNGVKRLRQLGWPIQRSEVNFSDPNEGITVKLALYYLPPTAIFTAGDRCRLFLAQVRIANRQKPAQGEAR